MARTSSKSSSRTSKRPHPMPRKAGVGTGRGYKCGGKIKK
jgi:hypothetical protein